MTPRRRLRAAGTHAGGGTRRRRLMTIGAAIVLALAISALCNQYAKTYTLAREKARLEQHRHDLIADNARLRDEIQRLQTDDRYIEQIARQQLGLVRPGEVELLVVPFDGTASAPGATPRGTPSARTSGAAVDPSARAIDPAHPAAGADTASRPRRGIGAWAASARDAVMRLLRVPHR